MSSTCRAIVVGIHDPEAKGRVSIRFAGSAIDAWAPVLRPYFASLSAAGPQVGDVVLVDFEGGDIRHPFVIGRLQAI